MAGAGAGQAPATGDNPQALHSSSGGVQPLHSSSADGSSSVGEPAQLPGSPGKPVQLQEITKPTTGGAAACEPVPAALVQPCHPQAGSPAAPPQPVPAKPSGPSGRRAQPGRQCKQRGCCTGLRRLLAPYCGRCFGRASSTGASPSMAGGHVRQPSHWDQESWAPSSGSCGSSPTSTSAASLPGLTAAAAPGSSAPAPASQQQRCGTREGMVETMDSAPCDVLAGSLPGAEESTPTLHPMSAGRWAGV